MKKKVTLGTVWTIPDDLWEVIVSILPPEKPRGSNGRPRLDSRRVFDGILFVLRTGCQWRAAPSMYGSGSSLHRYFQAWEKLGVFDQLWARLLEIYNERVGIGWDWQSADGTMVKSPLGGSQTGPNPTDRAKSGVKRLLLVDRHGAPLAMELAGANRPDMKKLADVLEQIVVERPEATPKEPQNICLDKGFDFPSCDATVEEHGYISHTRRRGEPLLPESSRRHPARRWVVERTHSWHNRFRKLLVRFEKKAENYCALVDFASALIVYRIIYAHSPTATVDDVLGVLG